MEYVFHEPEDYSFKDRNGHDGKSFDTRSPTTQHMIIECADKLKVSLTEQKSEFNYYIIEGNGYFIFNGNRQGVSKGDLIVLPPRTKYTFGGQLKMLLINTPKWTAHQEKIEGL